MDTEGEGEPLNPNEIELVFKPHPTEMTGDNQLMRVLRDNSVRYIKTTANASGQSFSTMHIYILDSNYTIFYNFISILTMENNMCHYCQLILVVSS